MDNQGRQWNLTRLDAIRIIDNATDKDDPYWDQVVEDFYDEVADEWPSIYDVFAALGITKQEYLAALGYQEGGINVNWPEQGGEQ